MDSLNGEEKKDASKEDLEQEDGERHVLPDPEKMFKVSRKEDNKSIGKRTSDTFYDRTFLANELKIIHRFRRRG